MRKIIYILIFGILLSAYLVHHYYYQDKSIGCYIKIIPTFLPGNLDTKEVLQQLKKSDPTSYLKVCENVKTIRKSVGCGTFGKACFDTPTPDTIYVGNDQGNVALAAATIVYETCHALQVANYQAVREIDCFKQGADHIRNVTVIDRKIVETRPIY